jgi:dimethylamine monooxygenase subunit A
MHFDFEAAVSAPFRMQPGLRRLSPGAQQLTPLHPGSRHQREKLAVLSAFWPQALVEQAGFDATVALHTLCAHAAHEHPTAWRWNGARAEAVLLGAAVESGAVAQLGSGSFGLGDEITRCLDGLPPAWRLAGLLSLAFEEDFAIVDTAGGTLPWIAACLPSHWAPEHKVGLHFAAVHAPVADNTLLLRATGGLMRLVSGPDRWERFVWNVTDDPRLHTHPARVSHERWRHTPVAASWFRSERQTFIPVPDAAAAVFTIQVAVQPLAQVIAPPGRAAALHAAIGTMSEAVLRYRGLTDVREPLLHWLADRAAPGAAPVA